MMDLAEAIDAYVTTVTSGLAAVALIVFVCIAAFLLAREALR